MNSIFILYYFLFFVYFYQFESSIALKSLQTQESVEIKRWKRNGPIEEFQISTTEKTQIELIDDQNSSSILDSTNIKNIVLAENNSLKIEQKIENQQIVEEDFNTRRNKSSDENRNGQEVSEVVEEPETENNYDDLPLGSVDDRTDEDLSSEECLENKENLSRDVISRLLTERRHLLQLIKRINKQQSQFCQMDQTGEVVPYRKCPIWRQEKLVHYYKLMRITYCSNYGKWPEARRVKRIYGTQLSLFEKFYAFIQ